MRPGNGSKHWSVSKMKALCGGAFVPALACERCGGCTTGSVTVDRTLVKGGGHRSAGNLAPPLIFPVGSAMIAAFWLWQLKRYFLLFAPLASSARMQCRSYG